MELKKLLKGIKILNAKNVNNVNIKNVSNKTIDDLSEGLYICIKGHKVDGHNLKKQAKSKGAIAFLVEKYDKHFEGNQIVVKDTRMAMSIIAKNFYGDIPKVIGITGTNGKTTTTNMVCHIMSCMGIKNGLIGTEGVFYEGQKYNLNMTTPDPLDLFKHLSAMAKSGVKYAVMEVSAHSIFLSKINPINFYIKAITNITEDHLDFFKTMKNYSKTKLSFIKKGKNIKIVNLDDDYCKSLASLKNVYCYSNQNSYANIYAKNIAGNSKNYDICFGNESVGVCTNLLGDYNISNALCASLVCLNLNIKLKDIVNALKTFKSVEGRLNVYVKDKITAVIDFAHTPDAIFKILTTLKKCTNQKIITIFGCGGNRDSKKRKFMGEVASKFSDFVIISSDNPRYESPDDIAKDILKGIKGDNYLIEQDRKIAIKKAFNMAKDGDIIAILGKGAEDYIEQNGVKYPYSDKQEILNLGFKE